MAVIRINKTKNYTVMSNHHLKNKNMSLKAKGLLSLMLSLPDDWDYSVSGLVEICLESKTAIQNVLKELESLGYLHRTRTQDSKGLFRYIYDIFEQPQATNPQTENQFTDNPCTDNRQQLNTKELNTKELNTNLSKKESENAKPKNEQKDSKKTFNELIEGYTDNKELREELKEHLKTRKSKKASLTNRAVILSLNKLDALANNDREKILIVQNSIMNGWTGFFPLKKGEAPKQKRSPSYSVEEFAAYNMFED